MEIKVTEALRHDAEALASASTGINSEGQHTAPAGLETLPTCRAYARQEKKIEDLMELYSMLLMKDAQDVVAFVDAAQETDEAIAAVNRNA